MAVGFIGLRNQVPKSVEIEGKEELSRFVNELPITLFTDVKTIFQKRAAKAHSTVQDNARTKLKRRTGQLARSIKYSVTGETLKTLEASVYASKTVGSEEIVYAKTHEFGATITAKKAYKRVPGGPYLNIPTDANQTPAGVMRMGPREVFNQGGFMKRLPSGRWGVIHPDKGLMFILVKRVTIPARLGMRDAVEAEIPWLLDDLRQLRWGDKR